MRVIPPNEVKREGAVIIPTVQSKRAAEMMVAEWKRERRHSPMLLHPQERLRRRAEEKLPKDAPALTLIPIVLAWYALDQAEEAVQRGDIAQALNMAFAAGERGMEPWLLVHAPKALARYRADAACIGRHSPLTEAERDSIGALVLAKLHELLPRNPTEPDKAKGAAYDAAHAWGLEQYGMRMPDRNSKYPARYFLAYLKRHGLTDPAP
jgi:hypothetical protein